jgi:regulator of sigma E protease
MDLLQKALWFIVAISVLVAAHEYGHFVVARALGFKVLRFSIGFGRPLLSWRGRAPDHIQYWISMLPLGGYVKMLDEHEGPVVAEERHRAFHQRPVWQRVAVLLAGPAFNFLFAILAYWLMFVTGVLEVKPFITSVDEGSVAARAELRVGEEITAIGGQATATQERALLRIFDEILDDGRIELALREPNGAERNVQLDVRGREAELTEPAVLFKGLGFQLGDDPPAVVGQVEEGKPADRAGLRPADWILRANGQAIGSWGQWLEFVRSRPGETVEIAVLRGDSELTFRATLDSATSGDKTVGRIGMAPAEFLIEQRYGVVEAFPRAVGETWGMVKFSVSMVTHMVMGQVSLKNMSGPLSIADIAGDAAKAGFPYYMKVLALVSISLGILNLLPIPLLDGGQIVYQLAEWVKGAPLSERAMVLGQQIGIFFVIALTGFAFYNDIARLFGS